MVTRKRKKIQPAELLGPLEVQVMSVLWRHRNLTGVEVTGFINKQRQVGLSHRTILTILSRLEAKGCIGHVVEGRAYRYSVTVTEADFPAWHAQRSAKALLDRYGTDLAVTGFFNAAVADPAAAARLDELLDQYFEDES
jgi:predicted transcriptional regulator